MGNIIETSDMEKEDGPDIFKGDWALLALIFAILALVVFSTAVITKEVMERNFEKSWQAQLLKLAEKQGCDK